MHGSDWVRLTLGLALLVAIAMASLRASGVRLERAVATAVARAVIQLSLIGLALHGVFNQPWTALFVLLVMLSAAVLTSSSRLGREHWRAVAVSISAGLGVVLLVVFAAGALPWSVRYVVALAGITTGNAMTAVTIAGRAFRQGLRVQRKEIEAWLAIGASRREACAPMARQAITNAMIPNLDQTRTVGLVTLPGTFIGALLGGASAAAASRFQLVALVAILASQAMAASMLLFLTGAPAVLPDRDDSLLP